MNLHKINHLYFFIFSLLFVLLLNGGMYYLHRQYIKPESLSVVDGPALKVKSFESEIESDNIDNNPAQKMKIEEDEFVLGSVNAPIELVIYDDPTGPFSPEYFPRLRELEEEFRGKIKIVLRLLSLDMHKLSRDLCLSVVCAGEQGRYFEAYEEILEANSKRKINEKYIDSFASNLDLNIVEFEACILDGNANEKLEYWIEEAEKNYVTGLPSTFINSKPYFGAYHLDDFKDSAGFERDGLRTIIKRLVQ